MAAEDGTSESWMMSSMFSASWVDSSKNSEEDILSSEEVAWIDSCLTTDSDILDSGWGALKDALTEVITIQSQPLDSSISSTAGYDIQMLHSTEDLKTSEFASERNTEEEEDDATRTCSPHQVDSSDLKNVFLPNYKEFPEEAPVDVDSNLLQVVPEVEDSSSLAVDIFKVWDLEIPDEEDEFEKQLNKAFLSEVEDRDLLDKLVTGIADMSL